MIKGVIPAAGRGTRLYPYPGNKEMFPMGYTKENGKERLKIVSEYLLESMLEAGVEVVYWVINHEKSDLIEFFGNGSRFGAKFVYLVQEEMVGMPQAIDQATPFINKEDKVLFGMPDTIFEPKDGLKKMSNYQYINTDSIYTGTVYLGTFPTEFYWKFGMVEYGEHSKIIDIVDKPQEEPSTEWAWGNAVFGYKFMQYMNMYIKKFEEKNDKYETELVLGDIFRAYLEETGKVKGRRFDGGVYFDIGTSGELKRTLNHFNK